ncbi:hypothetical protein SO694_00076175 [Aureococcus anophagefferens]|uniref:Uncharacterized protein n=1 Tax=Aureococcus anophagefferens TaxID=44056 RepID=A0ABR1FHX8_AURAN
MADDQDPSCSPDSGSVNNNGDAQQVAPPTMDVIGAEAPLPPSTTHKFPSSPSAPSSPARPSPPRARETA